MRNMAAPKMRSGGRRRIDFYIEPKPSYIPLGYAEHGRNQASTPERAPPLTLLDARAVPARTHAPKGRHSSLHFVFSGNFSFWIQSSGKGKRLGSDSEWVVDYGLLHTRSLQ